MAHFAVRIDQPEYAGSILLTFADQGTARRVAEDVEDGADSRTSATYIGSVSSFHVTQTLNTIAGAPSARAQLMEAYERALPHRKAYDVTGIKVERDGDHQVAQGYVVGGLRSVEGK